MQDNFHCEETEITDEIDSAIWEKFQDFRRENGGEPSEVMSDAEMMELLRLIAAAEAVETARRIAYENSPQGIAENVRILALLASLNDDGGDGEFIS
jgi:hypothetical protein